MRNRGDCGKVSKDAGTRNVGKGIVVERTRIILPTTGAAYKWHYPDK